MCFQSVPYHCGRFKDSNCLQSQTLEDADRCKLSYSPFCLFVPLAGFPSQYTGIIMAG